jgi:hypothetical protein
MEIIRVSADNNDIDLAAFTKVLGAWLVGGSDAATADVYDAATVTGTAKFQLKAAINTCSPYLNFGHPGVPFKTAISVDLTGTGMILFLVVE